MRSSFDWSLIAVSAISNWFSGLDLRPISRFGVEKSSTEGIPFLESARRARCYDVGMPTPPTGSVGTLESNPAIIGRASAIAACTDGKASDALWLAASVQTSVIQI